MKDTIEDGTWIWKVSLHPLISRRGSGFAPIERKKLAARFTCDGVTLETTDIAGLFADPESALKKAKDEADGRFWTDASGREWFVRAIPPVQVMSAPPPDAELETGVTLDTKRFGCSVVTDEPVDVDALSDDELEQIVQERYDQA